MQIRSKAALAPANPEPLTKSAKKAVYFTLETRGFTDPVPLATSSRSRLARPTSYSDLRGFKHAPGGHICGTLYLDLDGAE